MNAAASDTIPLTVLITTRNGGKWIRRVLDAYAAQANDCVWQMIIVDNNSTDDTAEILASYRDRLPLTVVQEPVSGQSRARNAGLAHVKGDFVVASDDDAIPHPGFLTGWLAASERFPDHDLFGGRIIPHFEGNPPAWILRLSKESEATFAKRDLAEGEIEADKIFGPNMGYRRRVFESGLKFDERIGPNAHDPNYPTGTETDFLRRAAAAGWRAVFVVGPTVEHIVRPNQTTMAFFRAQAFRDGRSGAMLDRQTGALRKGPWAHKGLVRSIPPSLQLGLMWLRAAIQPDTVQRCFKWWAYEWWRGYLAEAHK